MLQKCFHTKVSKGRTEKYRCQNHIALFAEAAKKIDMSNAGPYDQGLNESLQNAFKDYFTGTVDEDTAKANFETAIKEKYPELTDVVWPA